MSRRPLLLILALGAACLRSELPIGDTSTGDDTTGSSTSSSSSSSDDTTSTGDDSTSTSGDDTTTTGTTVAPSFCGDGTVDDGEQCDDGPDNSDQAACKLDCTPQVCGDGDLGPGEQCDDGNLDDADDCTAACAPAACGDGIVGPGEACDDGNTVDADTCTNACKLATCGDAIIQPPEACDMPGETATCDPDCTDVVCGDGVHNAAAGELCDDGNTNDSDFCRTDCTLPVCGDGWKQPGEACDDGNKIDGDGCTKQCGKQMISCQNGATLATVPANNQIALCHFTQFCEQDHEILCPFNWHLCSAAEFNHRNDTWDFQPSKLVLGAVHCRNDEGAGAFGFQHNLKTDHLDNCVYSSSRVECVGEYGCDDKNSYALCCAPLPFCGDGKLDPGEQCDDGNKDSDDDCFSNCMTRYADGDGCG